MTDSDSDKCPKHTRRQHKNQSQERQCDIKQETTNCNSLDSPVDFQSEEQDDSNSSSPQKKQSNRVEKKKPEKKLKETDENTRLKEDLRKTVETQKTKREWEKAKLKEELEEVKRQKTEREEENEELKKTLEEVKTQKTETEEENEELKRSLKKTIRYLTGLISVLVVVSLSIGLHSALKGHEMNHHEIRLMLVGKTGAGKSASGNTILGEEAFRVEASPASVTASCTKKNKVLDGRNITIIDTPGVMDTWLMSDQMAHHSHACISMYSPDPHVFLLVIRLGRFTVEESNAVKWIQENFGEEALKFTMILFTGGDLLEGKPVEKFISNSYDLQNLVDTCEGRYHVFNNYEQSNRTQVTELFKKINVILHKNMGYYYTKEVHQKVQRSTREEEERKRLVLQKEKEQALNECNSKKEEILQEEELKRKQMEEEMKVEEKRKMNEMAIKLRDEQYENRNLKAELKDAYSTSFWFRASAVLLIIILIIVVCRQKLK